MLWQNKKFLIFLFCVSFFARVLFFVLFLNKNKNYSTYDTSAYNDIALQIVNGNGITNLDGSAHFYRVPGYSLFLAFCYKLFGADIKKALWIQLFFASLIPLLIFFLSIILFSENILLAKISAIFSAFHLGFVLFSGFAMTESFFVLFFLFFLLCFFPQFEIFFCRKNTVIVSNKKLFFAGIFLGICSLIRPVGHYLMVISLMLLVFSSLNFLKKFKSILILFSGWFLMVFWWLLRNWLLTSCIFFHTLPGVHFLKHSAARLASEIYNCSYMQGLKKVTRELDVLIDQQERKIGKKVNEIEFCQLAEKVSFKYFKKNVFLTLKHFMINIIKTCFSLYSAELLYIDSGGDLPDYSTKRRLKDILKRFFVPKVSNKFLIPIIYFEILFLFFLWLGLGCFIVNSFFIKENLCLLIKILPFMALFIFVSLACGFARLRLPIEPFLIILSFKFWIEFFRRKKRILWKQS